MYLLDTNIWIALSKKEKLAMDRLRVLPANRVRSCSVVWGELMYGANKSMRMLETAQGFEQLLDGFVSLPFDDEAGLTYGRVRAHLERLGTPVGHNDLQIAAIALVNDCVVVTRNEREFRRVPGLRVDTWT